MDRKGLTVLAVLLLAAVSAPAQVRKMVSEKNQQWVGYMTQTRFTDRISWWNDFHYNAGAFAVARTGISLHLFNNQVVWTNGYGHLWLTANSTDPELNRIEHRPWGQFATSQKLGSGFSYNTRFRYEARYRQRVASGQVTDGYNFNWRVRFLMSVRKSFDAWKTPAFGTPFIGLTNEALNNAGDEVIYNHMDQNRTWITLGTQFETFNVQAGYMNRFVQQASGNRFVRNHTLILWVTQTFDLRAKPAKK